MSHTPTPPDETRLAGLYYEANEARVDGWLAEKQAQGKGKPHPLGWACDNLAALRTEAGQRFEGHWKLADMLITHHVYGTPENARQRAKAALSVAADALRHTPPDDEK